MHCNPCLQAGRGSPRVAVLDSIHGASTIAKRMMELGIQAEAFEVYHHTPNIDSFGLIVAPVHLGPANPALFQARRIGTRIITHHQAVGELVRPSMSAYEVTGTHSKTSTSLLLARILSGKGDILSHTTRGIELWSRGSSRLVRSGLSITPANVIYAVEAAEANHADAIVCEVSLGGTGLADYGVLTSFAADYRIAQGESWASTAKQQMISLAKKDARLVANEDTRISSDLSFGTGGCVRVTPDRLYLKDETVRLDLGEDLDYQGYETAISAAAAACYASGVGALEIAEGLEGFDGFSGRMKVRRDGGSVIIDSSNSGLKVADVARALDRLGGVRLGLVVGEESETVCEGMDIPGLFEMLSLRRKDVNPLVLVGARLQPWAEELKALTAPDLAEGERTAREAGGFDQLLLCVKCFR